MSVEPIACPDGGVMPGLSHDENPHAQHPSGCPVQGEADDCGNGAGNEAKQVSFCVGEDGLDTCIYTLEAGEGDYDDFVDARNDAINYLQFMIDDYQSLIDEFNAVTTFEEYSTRIVSPSR